MKDDKFLIMQLCRCMELNYFNCCCFGGAEIIKLPYNRINGCAALAECMHCMGFAIFAMLGGFLWGRPS